MKMKFAVLAISALSLSLFSSSAGSARADSGPFKVNFNLLAESAVVSEGTLTLSGVSPAVFAVESDADAAYGVTESTAFFLNRWKSLDHDIRPRGILFTSGEPNDGAYRALRFGIDNPSPLGDGQSVDWVFEIDHVQDARGSFKEARVTEPVMLTVVMAHTPGEVEAGRVCGPWDVSDLMDHHDLLEDEQ